MTLPITLSLIFITLAAIHFNWVFGGRFGFAAALPTKITGERVLNPKTIDSAIVGLVLTIFSLFYLLKSGLISFPLPQWLFSSIGWVIPTIFLLRAIGDFKYVGFFKRVRSTKFGKLDSKFFSPLCLLIAILGLIIQFR